MKCGKKRWIWALLVIITVAMMSSTGASAKSQKTVDKSGSGTKTGRKVSGKAIQGQPQLKNVMKAARRNGKWVKSAGRYKFRFINGTYASHQWVNIKGKIYYFNKEGFRVSGWKKYGNYKYFLNKDGSLRTGWFQYKRRQYYSNTRTGVMRTGWFNWHKNKYYFGKDGKMAVGWRTIDKKRYHFGKYGKMSKGFQKIGSATYYFTGSGRRVTGWLRYHNKYYYLKSDGRMAAGWLKRNGKKYYFREDGTRTTGDSFIEGQWYHFNKNGVYDPKAKVTPKIDPKKPMVALTFDDGPGPYTERLLDCIERNKVRATFFLVGQSIPIYPNAVKREYDLKCEIGNHTYDHPQLTRISDSQISSQINSTNTNIRNITGHNATLLRPPYGAYNAAVNTLAGMPVIMWSIDTRDWETRNTQSTVDAVLNHVRDGDIILMHDIHLPTVAAAEIIIPELLGRGYQLVTVSELGYYKRGGLTNGAVYSSLY